MSSVCPVFFHLKKRKKNKFINECSLLAADGQKFYKKILHKNVPMQRQCFETSYSINNQFYKIVNLHNKYAISQNCGQNHCFKHLTSINLFSILGSTNLP